MHWYKVTPIGGISAYILAVNSTDAKREYCRRQGIAPNDYWVGVAALSAVRCQADDYGPALAATLDSIRAHCK